MREQKKYCDRCGKEEGKTERFYPVSIDLQKSRFKSIDLCPSCYEAFEKFMKELNEEVK